jgi:protease-4
VEQQQQAATTAATNGASASSTNGSTPPSGAGGSDGKDDSDAPSHLSWRPDASAIPPLAFTPLSGGQEAWTKFKLAFALPWRRFKPEAVLAFKLEGELSDKLQVGLWPWLWVGVSAVVVPPVPAHSSPAACVHPPPTHTHTLQLPQGRFSPGFSLPQVIDSLEKAALDPRVKGIAVEIGPLAVRAVFAWCCVFDWSTSGLLAHTHTHAARNTAPLVPR